MSLSDAIDIQSRLLAPKIVAVLIVLASIVSVHLPGIGNIIPLFNIMMIYYWSIYRPELMPTWFVCLLGLFQDALYGTPLGMTALINLILRAVVLPQRRLFIKASYIVVWIGFLVFSLGIVLVSWILFSLYAQAIMPFREAFVQWVLSAALYSCIHWILNLVYSILPDRQSHSHA